MKEIKRKLMDGYVQFTDGTYGVKITMEMFLTLAKGKGKREYYIDEDDSIYLMVHPDEASAHETKLYVDTKEELTAAINKFYDMYTEDDTPFLLNINVLNAVQVLQEIEHCGGKEVYTEYRTALIRDIAADMEYFGGEVARTNSESAKEILGELAKSYNDVYGMEE